MSCRRTSGVERLKAKGLTLPAQTGQKSGCFFFLDFTEFSGGRVKTVVRLKCLQAVIANSRLSVNFLQALSARPIDTSFKRLLFFKVEPRWEGQW